MTVVPDQVRELLAVQCQAIDRGDFKEYGRTFAVDAVFDNRAAGAVLTGREQIGASAVRHAAARRAQGAVLRHYMFGTGLAGPVRDGIAEVTSTTLIVCSTAAGVAPLAVLSCRDRIALADGPPRVLHRLVDVVGPPPGPTAPRA